MHKLFMIIQRSLLASALFSPLAALATEGTPEQKKACTPDAMHLCNQYIPDAEKVKKCLADHVGDLSPACKEVFEGRSSS